MPKLGKQFLKQEMQYLNLVKNIIRNGEVISGRNGNTKRIVGSMMKFSLKNNTIPLLTTKHVAWKTCLKELLWFVNGETDNTKLQQQNVKIWNDNSSREFLDSRGLFDNVENDLGPIYGHQWRYFNAPYFNCDIDYSGFGVDQLQNIIDSLKHPENKLSRRLIMSAWNPQQLNQMALPPCHVLSQFHVNHKNELSCSMYQRSGDVGLGVPFNIASYSFLTHLLAKHCNLKAKEFIYHIGDAHIYETHETILAKQLEREILPFPTIYVLNKYDNINEYEVNDFDIKKYVYAKKINMKMVA